MWPAVTNTIATSGCGSDRIEDLPDDLTGRMAEQRVLRQRGAEALQDAPPSSGSSTGGISV